MAAFDGSVERVALAPGISICRIVTGLWQVADLERLAGAPLDVTAASAHLAPYVEAGLTTFDMADHYGSSELIAGEFASGGGGSGGGGVELLTKVCPTAGKVTREAVREAVALACKRLQTDCVDLLQLHSGPSARNMSHSDKIGFPKRCACETIMEKVPPKKRNESLVCPKINCRSPTLFGTQAGATGRRARGSARCGTSRSCRARAASRLSGSQTSTRLTSASRWAAGCASARTRSAVLAAP